MNSLDYRPVGGVPVMQGENVSWNFGVLPKSQEVHEMIQAKPTLWSQYPHMQGAWDGTSTVNHVLAAQKVLGDQGVLDLIQKQPRGTCGGRSGSETGDFIQLIMIALGKRVKFHRVSHAAVYYAARKLYQMLSGNWQDKRTDGVASGAVPEALAKIGFCTREEVGDTNYYGDGSDDLACQLGAGQHSDLAQKIEQLAKDNIVTDWSPVHSAQELADGIAAGGIGIGSDTQGFETPRDSQGFCRPAGQWAHYQIRVSVFGGARKGFGYWQSWGRDLPQGGSLLPGHPPNCFGVDFSVQDHVIKSGDWAVVFGFTPFELESVQLVDIPWRF